MAGISDVRTTRKPLKGDSPNCTECGLCCIALQDQEAYCDVEPRDIQRLPKKFVRLNVIDVGHGERAIRTKWRTARGGPLRGIATLQCVALRGDPLHRVGCTVYEIRPTVCRTAIQPGDKHCEAVRRLVMGAVDRQGD